MPLIEKNWKQAKVDNDRVILDSSYSFSPKKITGHRIAGICDGDKYNSEFKIWMEMVKLYKQPDMDKTIAMIGNTFEEKLRAYGEEKLWNLYHVKYISYDPFKISFDSFQENKIFGGIPDGEPSINGRSYSYESNAPMMEIKTTSVDKFDWRKNGEALNLVWDGELPKVKKVNAGKEGWFINDEIQLPSHYLMQLCLYMYLRNITNGVFVVGFVETLYYANPKLWKPSEENVTIVEVKMNDNFKHYINKAEKWWNDYIEGRKSPIMTDEDKKWLSSINI